MRYLTRITLLISLTLSWTAAIEDPDFTETLALLNSHLVDPQLIKPQTLKEQTASALLQQIGYGSLLMTRPSDEGHSATPIRSEILQPYKIGYLRMPSFKPSKDWNSLHQQLVDWQKSNVFGLIIDVRDFEGSSDFSGAAHAASLFCPPQQVLFSTQGLKTPQQLYSGNRSNPLTIKPLVIVINRQTLGAAEAFVSSMREITGAILIGRSTSGRAALYTDFPLKSGKFVRIPTATVQSSDGTRLFGKPIQPDISLYTEDLSERQAIAEGQLSSSSSTIREIPSRQTISEAALVRQDNPEFDEAAIAQKKKKKEDSKKENELIQDITLIRAVDIVRGIQIRSQMTWK